MGESLVKKLIEKLKKKKNSEEVSSSEESLEAVPSQDADRSHEPSVSDSQPNEIIVPKVSPFQKIFGLLKGISAPSSSGGSTCVGLSIGTSSIKIVEMKVGGKNPKILNFGMIQLPEDAVVSREIVNGAAVSESIKTLISKTGIKTKEVCISLSGNSVIVKRMTVEVAKKSEMEETIFWEAEQYLPFDPADVIMDYELLAELPNNQCDVLLIAVKKTVLEAYLSAVSDAGLKPTIVDIDFFALQNVFEANYQSSDQEAFAIADVGAIATKVVVVHKGVPVFVKDSEVGGKTLTTEIQNQLGLSYADAEALKTSGVEGGGTPQEVSELMNLMSQNLAGEIKRAIDYYNASAAEAPVTQILIAGGSASLPGFSQHVQESTGLPSQLLNTFGGITYDASVLPAEFLDQISSIAAIPVGLALRAGAE